MEAAVLHQFLKNLCAHAQWSYAVFWRLHQLDTLQVLRCENEYCDPEKARNQACPIILCEFYSRQEINHSWGHPITSAIFNMSRSQFLLGEGMVGRVALGESCLWLYSDDIHSTELISNFGYANEWLLPIATGIKTTLLIPVLPFGVLQLGSFDKVAENQTVAVEIRDMFFTLTSTISSPSSEEYSDNLYFFPSNAILYQENIDESSLDCSILKRLEYENIDMNHNIEFLDNYVQTSHQVVPFMFGNSLDKLDDTFDQYFDTNFESNTQNMFIITDEIPEEFYDTNELIKDFYEEICTDIVPEEVKDQSEYEIGQNYELQEALVPGFSVSDEKNSWNSLLIDEDSEKSDSLEEMFSLLLENSGEFSMGFLQEEGIVSNQEQWNNGSEYQGMEVKTVISLPSFESVESPIVGDEEQEGCANEFDYKKSKKVKLSSRKEKPKNNCRPRPRDRQLIQDRLKELRKLVPNGAKCSIDGLLDHTKKHMVFLKNVIEQADKVKQFIEQEIWKECSVSSYKCR